MATAAIRSAYEEVRADSSETHWVIARADDAVKAVELLGTGTGGLDEFLQQFDDAATAMWGVLRVRAVDDRGTVKSVRAKFIRVDLLPDSMSVMKRAKAGALKASIDESFPNTHANFNISAPSELTREKVTKQLQATCGAHMPSYYDFDGAQGADAAASNVPAAPTSKASASSPTAGGEAGADAPPPPAEAVDGEGDDDGAPPPPAEDDASASSSPVRQPPPAATKAPSPNNNSKSSGATPSQPANADVASLWKTILSDASPNNWIAVTYDGNSLDSVKVAGFGENGLDEMKEAAFDDEEIVFAALRVTAIDDRGSVKSVRAKYVFVQFIGNGVRPMQRARAGGQRSYFENLLSGCHISVNISAAKELDAAGIERKLSLSCGAHAPNRYEFGKQVTNLGDF